MESTPLSENYCYSGIVGYHHGLDYVIHSKANTEELYLALHKAAKEALFAVSKSKDQDNFEFNIKLGTENISKDYCINVSVTVNESKKEIIFIGTQTKKKQLTPAVAEPTQLPNSNIVDGTQEDAVQNESSDDQVDKASSPSQSFMHTDAQTAQNVSEQSEALNDTSASSCINLCSTVSDVNIGNRLIAYELTPELSVVNSPKTVENTNENAQLDNKVDMSNRFHLILSSILHSNSKTRSCEQTCEPPPSPVPNRAPTVEGKQENQQCSKHNVYLHDRIESPYTVYQKNKKETSEEGCESCTEDNLENHKCSKQNVYLHERIESPYTVYRKNKKETSEEACDSCAEDTQKNQKYITQIVRLDGAPSLVPTVNENQEFQKSSKQYVYLHDKVEAPYSAYKKNKRETNEEACEACIKEIQKCSKQNRVEAPYSAYRKNKRETNEETFKPSVANTQTNQKYTKQNMHLHDKVAKALSTVPTVNETQQCTKCKKQRMFIDDKVEEPYAASRKNKRESCEQTCSSVRRNSRIQCQEHRIKTSEQCCGLDKDVVNKRIMTQHERMLQSSFELNQSIKQLKQLHQYLYSKSDVKPRCPCQSTKSDDQIVDIQATKRLCELNATLAKTNFHVLTDNEDNAPSGASIYKPCTQDGANSFSKKPDIHNDHNKTDPCMSITKKSKYTSSISNKKHPATNAADSGAIWNPIYKSSYYEMDYLGNGSSDISLRSKVSQTEITNNDVMNMAKVLMKHGRYCSLTNITSEEEHSFEKLCKNRDKTNRNMMYGNSLKKFDRANYTPGNRSKSAPFMLNNLPKISKSTQELMDLLTHNLDGIIEIPKDINDTGFIYRPTKFKGATTNTSGCVTIFQATNLKYNELLIHKILTSKSTSFPIVTDVHREADESDADQVMKETSISEIKITGKWEHVSDDLLSVGVQTSLPILTGQEHFSECSTLPPTRLNVEKHLTTMGTQAFLTTMSSLEFVSSEEVSVQREESMKFPVKNNLKKSLTTVGKQADLLTLPYVKDEATSSTTLAELQRLETKPMPTLSERTQISSSLCKVSTNTATVLDNDVMNVPLRAEKIYHVTEQCCTPKWMATNENYVHRLNTNVIKTKMSLESLSSENCTPVVSEIIKIENKVTHAVTTQTSRPSCEASSAILFNDKGTLATRKRDCHTCNIGIPANVSYECCTSSSIAKKTTQVTNTGCDLTHTASSTVHISGSRYVTDFGIMCGAPIVISRCSNDAQTNLSLIDIDAFLSKNHVTSRISDVTIQTSRSDYCNDSGTMCDTPATLSTYTDITQTSSLSISLHRKNNDCRAAVYNNKVQQSSIRTKRNIETFTSKSEHGIDSGTICDQPMSISTSTDGLNRIPSLPLQPDTVVQFNAIPTTLRIASNAVQEEAAIKTQVSADWVETGTMCDSPNMVSTSTNGSIATEIFQHTPAIPEVCNNDANEGINTMKSIPHIFHEREFYNANTILPANNFPVTRELLASSENLQRSQCNTTSGDPQITDSSSQTNKLEHWFDPATMFGAVDKMFDKSNVSSYNDESNLLLIKKIEYLVVKDGLQTVNKNMNVSNKITQTSKSDNWIDSSTMSDIPATESTATDTSDSNESLSVNVQHLVPNSDVTIIRKTSECVIDQGTMYEIDSLTTTPKHTNCMKTSTSTLSALEDTTLVLRNATKSRPVTQTKYWSEETTLCDLSSKYSALINKAKSSMSIMSTANQPTTNNGGLPVKPFTSNPDFDSKYSPTDSFILFKDKNKNTNKLKVLNQLDYSGVKIFIAKTEKDGVHQKESNIHIINLSELKNGYKNKSSEFVETKVPMSKCSKGIMVIPRKSVTIVDHKDQENKIPKSISSILKKQMSTDVSIRPTNLKKQEENNLNNQWYKKPEETNIISNKHAAIDIKTIDSTFYKFLENYVDNSIKEKMKALNLNPGPSHSQTETSSQSSDQTKYCITDASQSKSSNKLMKYLQKKSSFLKGSKSPELHSKTSIKTVSNIYENLNRNTKTSFLSPDKYVNLERAEHVRVLCQSPHTGEVRRFIETGKYGKILETENNRNHFDSKPKYPEPFYILRRYSSSDNNINIEPMHRETSCPLKLTSETDYYFETGKLVRNFVQCKKVYKPIKYSLIREEFFNLSLTRKQSANANCRESSSNIKTCRSRHNLNTELYNKTKSSLDVQVFTITNKRTGLEQKAKSENINTNSMRRSNPYFGSTAALKQTSDLDSFEEENGETSNCNQEKNSLLSNKVETDSLANNSEIHQNNLSEVVAEHLPSTSETGKNRVKNLWKRKRNSVNPENTNTTKDKLGKNNQESSHNSKSNNVPDSKIYYFKTIKSLPTESEQLFDYYKFREVKHRMNDNHSNADFERRRKIEEMNLLLLENNDLYDNSSVKEYLTDDCNRINANLKAVNQSKISSVVQKGNFTLENDGPNLPIKTINYWETVKYDAEEIFKKGTSCNDVIHQRSLLDSSEPTPSDDNSSAISRSQNDSNEITVNKEETEKPLKNDFHTEVAENISIVGSSSAKIHNKHPHTSPCKTADLLKRKHYYKVMNARTMSKDELAQKDNKMPAVHSDTLNLTSNIRRNHNSLEQIIKHKTLNEKQPPYSSACDTKATGKDQNGDFMIKSCQHFLESNISPDVKVQTEHITTTFGKEMNKLKREIVNSQSNLNYLKKLEDMETSMLLSLMAAQTIQVANNQFKEAVQNICESSSGTKSFHSGHNDDTVLNNQSNHPSIHAATNPDDIVLQATSLLANCSSRLLDMVNASMLSVKKLMNESLFGKTTSLPIECVDTSINTSVHEHVCKSLSDNFKIGITTNAFSDWTPAPVVMEVFPKINYDKCKDPLFPEIGQLEKINQIEEKLMRSATLNIMKKEFLQREPESSMRCNNNDTVIEDTFSNLLVIDKEIHSCDKGLPESYDSMNSFELKSINGGQYINKNVFNIDLRHKIETYILLIQKEILKFYILVINYSLSKGRNILESLNEETQRLLDSLSNTLQQVLYQAEKWSHPNISKLKELAANILIEFTLSFILPEVEEKLCLSDQAKAEMYSTVLRTIQLLYSKLQDLLSLCYSSKAEPALLSKSEGAVRKSSQDKTACKKNMSQGVICVNIQLENDAKENYSEESFTDISDESQSCMQDVDDRTSYTDDSDNVRNINALTKLNVADLKYLIIKQCDSNENEDLDNFLEKEISSNGTSIDNDENFSECIIKEPKIRTRTKYKATTMSSLITDLFKEDSDCCNVKSVDRVCIVTDDVSKDNNDSVDVDVLFESIKGNANESDVHLSAVDVNLQSEDNVDAYLQECINSAMHQLLNSDEKYNSKKLRIKTKDLNQPETSGAKKSAQIIKSNNTPTSASTIDADTNEVKKLKITFNKTKYMLDVESGLMAVQPPNINLNAYDKHQEKSKSKKSQKHTNLQLRNIYSSTEISILNNLRKNT